MVMHSVIKTHTDHTDLAELYDLPSHLTYPKGSKHPPNLPTCLPDLPTHLPGEQSDSLPLPLQLQLACTIAQAVWGSLEVLSFIVDKPK